MINFRPAEGYQAGPFRCLAVHQHTSASSFQVDKKRFHKERQLHPHDHVGPQTQSESAVTHTS